eukprot:4103605-Pleurochrysis_carterae.AAC.4
MMSNLQIFQTYSQENAQTGFHRWGRRAVMRHGLRAFEACQVNMNLQSWAAHRRSHSRVTLLQYGKAKLGVIDCITAS